MKDKMWKMTRLLFKALGGSTAAFLTARRSCAAHSFLFIMKSWISECRTTPQDTFVLLSHSAPLPSHEPLDSVCLTHVSPDPSRLLRSVCHFCFS